MSQTNISDVSQELLDNEAQEAVPELQTEEDDAYCGTNTSDGEDLQGQKAAKRFEEYTVSEMYALVKEFPEESVTADVMSEPFFIFAKDKTGSMSDIYSEYLTLKNAFNTKSLVRSQSGQKEERSHSGFGEAPARDISSGLTRRQMELARGAGMTYREYSLLLDSLPGKRIR